MKSVFGLVSIALGLSVPGAAADAQMMGGHHRHWHIVLFDRPGFQGRSVTITGPVPPARRLSLQRLRTERPVQVRGSWLVCAAKFYQNDCVTIDHDIPDLKRAEHEPARNLREAPAMMRATALVFALLVLAGCESTPAVVEPVTNFVGQDWRLTAIGGTPVAAGSPATLLIDATGHAAGGTGCNRFFAHAVISGNDVSFSAAGATKMACAAPWMDQESRYLTALAGVAHWRTENGALILSSAEGNDILTYAHGP